MTCLLNSFLSLSQCRKNRKRFLKTKLVVPGRLGGVVHKILKRVTPSSVVILPVRSFFSEDTGAN